MKVVLLILISIIMPKQTYTSLPDGYAVCEHSDCTMAATCFQAL